jgi:hypothetical protein
MITTPIKPNSIEQVLIRIVGRGNVSEWKDLGIEGDDNRVARKPGRSAKEYQPWIPKVHRFRVQGHHFFVNLAGRLIL